MTTSIDHYDTVMHTITEDHMKRLIRRVSIIYDVIGLEKTTSVKEDDDFGRHISFNDGEYIIASAPTSFDVYCRVTFPGSWEEPPSEDYKPIRDRKLLTMNDVALVILEDAIKEFVKQVEIDECAEEIEKNDIPF